jgi:hypothetical protein
VITQASRTGDRSLLGVVDPSRDQIRRSFIDRFAAAAPVITQVTGPEITGW